MSAMRNPSADPTPLDRASFYIEDLKYGPGPGKLEQVTFEQITAECEALLRDAGVESMTGQELVDAMEYYAVSLHHTLRAPLVLTRSIFLDGIMHGLALGAGLEGDLRRRAAAQREATSAAPDFRRGEQIGPGIYALDGAMHIDEDEFIRSAGGDPRSIADVMKARKTIAAICAERGIPYEEKHQP